MSVKKHFYFSYFWLLKSEPYVVSMPPSQSFRGHRMRPLPFSRYRARPQFAGEAKEVRGSQVTWIVVEAELGLRSPETQASFPNIHTMHSLTSYTFSMKKKEHTISLFFRQLFKNFYLFIFRERGRVGEREEEKHQCVVSSHAPPTGDLACNPGMCPDWESTGNPGSQPALSPLSHTSQGRAHYL